MDAENMTTFETILQEPGVKIQLSDIEEWDNISTWGPFLLAAGHGQTSMLRQMLEIGAKPDATIRKEETFPYFLDWSALHYAVYYNKIECVKVLMDHHANPTLKTDYTNMTPRQIAENKSYTEIASLLKKYEGKLKQVLFLISLISTTIQVLGSP